MITPGSKQAVREARRKLWAAITAQTGEPRKPRLVKDASGGICVEIPNGKHNEGTQIRRVAMIEGKPALMPRVRIKKKQRLAARKEAAV